MFEKIDELHNRRRATWRKLHKTRWWKAGVRLNVLPYRLAVYRSLSQRGIVIDLIGGKAREYLLELQWLEYEIQAEWDRLRQPKEA